MKAMIFALSVGLLMVGCGEGTVDVENLQDRNGVTHPSDEDFPFNGRSESFYKNGQKQSEINFKDGKNYGLQTIWYRNGQKREEGNFKDNKKDGPWTSWHENGQKESETNYKDREEVKAKVRGIVLPSPKKKKIEAPILLEKKVKDNSKPWLPSFSTKRSKR